MNLQLERADILFVNTVSCRNTLALVSNVKSRKQKLVIGDDTGKVSCFEFKRGEPQVVFEKQVFNTPVTCIATCWDEDTKGDQIYVCSGQRIIGLSKKGQEFFKLTSPVTENISALMVENTKIYAGFEYVYNLYDDAKELVYYLSKDIINNLMIATISNSSSKKDCILSCHDKCIRIIRDCDMILEIPTEFAVTCTSILAYSGDNDLYLLFGLESGQFGLVKINSSDENLSYEILWIMSDMDTVERASITCMKVFDISNSGIPSVIVGRDNGIIEVFSFASQSYDYKISPRLSFRHDIEQSVRAIDCGLVNSSSFYEIIVVGYSGKIISFTTEPVLQRDKDDKGGRSVQSISNENRIKFLTDEINTLKAQIEKEKSRHDKNKKGISYLKPPPDFFVNSKFSLDPSSAAYCLFIELQTPIDLVILRSPVRLFYLETGSAIISVTPKELISSNELSKFKYLAAFRCQSADSKRISIMIRTTEGEYGDFVVTVVSSINSHSKAAKVLTFPLKPLSLHTQFHNPSSDKQSMRPTNSIRFTGQFSMLMGREWILSIFPDISTRLDDSSVQEELIFKHTFTDSITTCRYIRNEISFESENASTISIIKENMVKLANTHRIQFEVDVALNHMTIKSFLHILQPKMEYLLLLSRKHEIMDAIYEISISQDSGASSMEWLSPEYDNVMKNQVSIQQEFKSRGKSLEFLSGIIRDLFIDWKNLSNVDLPRDEIEILDRAFSSGDFQAIIQVFDMENRDFHK